MASLQKKWKGLAFCLLLAVPSWFLGKMFPIIGGAVIAILAGMVIAVFMKTKNGLEDGIKFTSKKILQWAVILLGFGMNLNVVLETEGSPFPSLCAPSPPPWWCPSFCTGCCISPPTSLPGGSGLIRLRRSAIAATAPVIGADDEEIAQSISVIFLFNVAAALLFPTLGGLLGLGTRLRTLCRHGGE